MRSGGRVVEGARLESEYTPKAYRGFESLPLRHFHDLMYGFCYINAHPGASGQQSYQQSDLPSTRVGRFRNAYGKYRTLDALPVLFDEIRRFPPQKGQHFFGRPTQLCTLGCYDNRTVHENRLFDHCFDKPFVGRARFNQA